MSSDPLAALSAEMSELAERLLDEGQTALGQRVAQWAQRVEAGEGRIKGLEADVHRITGAIFVSQQKDRAALEPLRAALAAYDAHGMGIRALVDAARALVAGGEGQK